MVLQARQTNEQAIDEQAIKDWMDRYNALELEAQRFVSDELRLPDRWVASGLLNAFRVRVHNERHPDDEKPFGVQVFMPKGAPTGRRPRNDGQDLERDVRWYYRIKISSLRISSPRSRGNTRAQQVAPTRAIRSCRTASPKSKRCSTSWQTARSCLSRRLNP